MKKYKKKFILELTSGVRYDVYMSVDALCRKWGITRRSYYNWLDKYPEFNNAAECGERDYAAALHKAIMDIALGKEKGNAGLLTLAAQHHLGWKTKNETTIVKDEEIKTLTINVLPSRETNIIEHDNTLRLVKEDD